MQQTIEEAIWVQSGEKYPAKRLLELPTEELVALRRAAMQSITRASSGELAAGLVCAICGTPVYVSRQHRESGNRWFTHRGHPTECPWYEGKKLTPEQWNAYRYHGQQESEPHRFLKHFIADWLERDSRVPFVNRDKVTFGEVLKGEWKRPDVRCELAGKKLVFEIQLSYTFLSEVIKRDDFYRAEHTYVVWVFRQFDISRASHQDEAFYNRRNLFVLDEEAIAKTKATARLHFKCFFPRTGVSTATKDGWQCSLVTLDDLKFPEDNYRPYLVDPVREQARRAQEHHAALAKNFLDAATAYYDSDYSKGLHPPLLHAARGLGRHLGFPEAADETFIAFHRVLPKLLSLKHNRPVGYKYRTVYEVLNAALQPSALSERKFVLMYERAYRAFAPAMAPEHAGRVEKAFQTARQSIAAGEDAYVPDSSYDRLAAFLFPEMRGLSG